MAKQHSDVTIEKLTNYLTSPEGTVVLTDKDEQTLKLVNMAHDLFHAQRFTTHKIASIMCHHFGCSKESAHMAMRTAQIIFASKNIYTRAYMAELHLDEIVSDIAKARDSGDMETVVKLHAIKNKIIDMLPSAVVARELPPANINFFIYEESVNAPEMTIKDAVAKATAYLSKAVQEAEIVHDGD